MTNIYNLTEKEKQKLAVLVAQAQRDELKQEEMLRIVALHPRAEGFIKMHRRLTPERVQTEIQGFLKLMAAVLPTSPLPSMRMEPNTEKLPLKGDEESSNTQNPTPNTQDDSYLATLTYQQITEHTGLTDVQKKYWYDRRVENARKYLRDKLTAPYSDKKIEKAKGYIEELKLAGKKLSPRAIENIQSAGIEFPADMSE